jgi:quaternary ammonium compound-resistance protein SugE
MTAWIYLFVASLFEVGWMLSLKHINFASAKSIFARSVNWAEAVLILLPFAGYVAFGIGNIYCFSVATKQIPVSVAFAIWMGVALCGVKLIEIFIYKQTGSFMDYVFMTMLVVAIIGLKSGKV